MVALKITLILLATLTGAVGVHLYVNRVLPTKKAPREIPDFFDVNSTWEEPVTQILDTASVPEFQDTVPQNWA